MIDKTVFREFAVHKLNDGGITKAREIADAFDLLLVTVHQLAGQDGREIAIVRTKLEEACFFAKKAMAQRPENQDGA